MKTGELYIREDESGNADVIFNPVGNTVWLTQSEIARLLDIYTVTVANNLRSIFKSGVLREERVSKTYRYKTDSCKECFTIFYNLDAVIALAYRIRSRNAEIIRAWIPKMICRKKERVYTVLQYKASDQLMN